MTPTDVSASALPLRPLDLSVRGALMWGGGLDVA